MKTKPKSKSTKPTTTTLWAVLKTYTFYSLEVIGRHLHAPPEGPQRFIPVFNTKQQAIDFNGSDQFVVPLEITPINK